MVLREARPDPDELLARVKAEEEQKKRGKLKIFLGYAAGVGKTFTMLEAARQRKKELDVAVAYIETHHRAETEALLEGLEIIPRRQSEYRGTILTEMDIDAVLRRHPQLAIVDELAHTNTPDSRHPKRYQDIEELLAAGIDVYTTLNVQHIESLRNAVAQITSVWIRETIPDSVIDSASEIEIVDLPPDELIKRLKDGKVYVPEQIANAIEKFFRKGNLMALRELTMRTAGRHVDEETRTYMETHAIPGPWPSAERLLVCIRPGTASTRLIRSARRLAYQLSAEWFVLYVETPDSIRLSAKAQENLTASLRLAEKLGAKAVTMQGESVVTVIVDFARKNNTTRIALGKSYSSRLRRLLFGSMADNIARRGPFDVYILSGSGESEKSEREQTPRTSQIRRWRGYAIGLGLLAMATLFGYLIRESFAQTTILMLYLLAVLGTAIWGGLRPSIMVSIIGVLAFDFFFIRPYWSFAISDTQYLFTFLSLLLVGVIISFLTARFRRQTELARQKEQQTASLYELSKELAMLNDMDSYLKTIIKRVRDTFGCDAIIFLPDAQNKDHLKPFPGNANVTIDENESAAAVWSFQHQKPVGHGTDTLPNVKARYVPLVTARGAVGVLAIAATDSVSDLSLEQERLLEAYTDLAAVAIEAIQLTEIAHNAQILQETEKLQTALLNSISHDLRTPLVSIIGALSSLQEEKMHLDGSARHNLIQVAGEEADRLNRLITNLLDESRIEAGALRITKQPAEVQDIVGAALEQLGNRIKSRKIKIDLPNSLPFVLVDSGLIIQALVNILDNALKYSTPESLLDITGRQIDREINIEIADRGIGIFPEDLSHVFDKFYRVRNPVNVSGTGLGLSISKGIIEANGGHITAANRAGGGTVISVLLPVTEISREAGAEKDG
jgi:two-component system sensor histidine kinase KdpD